MRLTGSQWGAATWSSRMKTSPPKRALKLERSRASGRLVIGDANLRPFAASCLDSPERYANHRFSTSLKHFEAPRSLRFWSRQARKSRFHRASRSRFAVNGRLWRHLSQNSTRCAQSNSIMRPRCQAEPARGGKSGAETDLKIDESLNPDAIGCGGGGGGAKVR